MRWGALLRGDGGVAYVGEPPQNAQSSLRLIWEELIRMPMGSCGADFNFAGGRVLIRPTDEGSLILFCEDNIHVSLIDLVLGKEQDFDASPSSQPALITTGHSTSGIQTFDLSGRAVPESVIAVLLDIYAEFLGPLARKLAEKEARAAGIDLKKAPVKDWSRLLNTLAAKIQAEDKREAFLDRAVLLKTKFEEGRS